MQRLKTKAQRLAARWRPTECTETIEHPQGVVYHSPDKLTAIAYKGTAGRPSWHYRFNKPEHAEQRFAEFFRGLDQLAAYRTERNQATKAAKTNDIGEIYRRACESGSISPAETATLIRHRLRLEFPGTQFKVRTESHGTINVSWTDGPTQKAVNSLLDCYQFGGFDGMIDMAYHVDRWLYQDGSMSFAHTNGTQGSMGTVGECIGSPRRGDAVLVTSGPRYVFGHRRVSFDAALAQTRRYCRRFGIPMPSYAEANESALWNWLHGTHHQGFSISARMHQEEQAAA
jgi:hypothetical protein